MALRERCQAGLTTLEVVATAMAAAAGLLDLNEPMFGLSKVEVVQSIDPTKLQVSLDDCDLMCNGARPATLAEQARKASCGATDGACGWYSAPAPSSFKFVPSHHLSGDMRAIRAPWQEPACSLAGATHAGNPQVDHR